MNSDTTKLLANTKTNLHQIVDAACSGEGQRGRLQECTAVGSGMDAWGLLLYPQRLGSQQCSAATAATAATTHAPQQQLPTNSISPRTQKVGHLMLRNVRQLHPSCSAHHRQQRLQLAVVQTLAMRLGRLISTGPSTIVAHGHGATNTVMCSALCSVHNACQGGCMGDGSAYWASHLAPPLACGVATSTHECSKVSVGDLELARQERWHLNKVAHALDQCRRMHAQFMCAARTAVLPVCVPSPACSVSHSLAPYLYLLVTILVIKAKRRIIIRLAQHRATAGAPQQWVGWVICALLGNVG
jgi:hypothetical protein